MDFFLTVAGVMLGVYLISNGLTWLTRGAIIGLILTLAEQGRKNGARDPEHRNY